MTHQVTLSRRTIQLRRRSYAGAACGCLLLALGADAYSQPKPGKPTLLYKENSKNDAAVAMLRLTAAESVMSFIKIDSKFLKGSGPANSSFRLPVKGTDGIVLARVPGATAKDPVVWSGSDEHGASATLVVKGEKASGSVISKAGLFRIVPVGGTHALIQVDRTRLPPIDHSPPSAHLPAQPPPAPTGQAVQLDVLVAYTASAGTKSFDIQMQIAQAIAESNQAYAQSGAALTLHLAGTMAIDKSYTESGKDYSKILSDFAAMPDVKARRDAAGADISILLVDQEDLCGEAMALPATAGTAFAAVFYSCATGMNVFGHEIGHLLGALHDEAHDPSDKPFAYGHGYAWIPDGDAVGFSTIMAFGDKAQAPRIGYFSNPRVFVDGVAVGTAERNDVARVLNEQAPRAASFRPTALAPLSSAIGSAGRHQKKAVLAEKTAKGQR